MEYNNNMFICIGTYTGCIACFRRLRDFILWPPLLCSYLYIIYIVYALYSFSLFLHFIFRPPRRLFYFIFFLHFTYTLPIHTYIFVHVYTYNIRVYTVATSRGTYPYRIIYFALPAEFPGCTASPACLT